MGRAAFDFSGEVALITGVSGGLGGAIAQALVAAGARVHGLDLVPPGEATGEPAGTFHATNLRSRAEVDATVASILEAEGKIDHLVHAAGLNRDRMLWNLDDEDWESVIDVNLNAAHRLLRALAGPMREARSGRVVLISSINGMRGKAGVSNYGASKAGLIGLGRTAARELGPRGVTVNVVAPGMIDAGMGTRMPAEVLERSCAEAALGRLGTPKHVVDAVLFLLSDASEHVTGTVLPVDGGQLA